MEHEEERVVGRRRKKHPIELSDAFVLSVQDVNPRERPACGPEVRRLRVAKGCSGFSAASCASPAAVIQARNGRLRRPMVQRFQSPTLQASATAPEHGDQEALLVCRVPFLHDDAWKPANDDFDLTDLIATSFRSVRIREANRNPLDGCRELSELHPKLQADLLAIVVFDLSSKNADVCRRRHRMGTVARELHRAGQ